MFLYRVFAIVIWASAFCCSADAASASDSVTEALAQIPPCGIQCIAEKAPLIGCGLLDLQCQCTSKNSTAILQPCLLESCTFDETFEILRIQATICNKPHDSYTTGVRVIAYVSGIVPILAVSMRFASRWLGGNSFWWDDWLHLISATLTIPLTAVIFENAEAGLGKHLWDLTYDRVVAISRWTYIATVFWAFSLLILKYSILCMYLRIFPNVWLNRAIYAFMVFTACFTLPLIGLAIFQCTPIKAIWDLEAAKTAKCIDWITVLRLTVVYEVIAEVVIFSLPIPIVLKLQMKTAKKIQLCIFFGLGVVVIGVSIARVPFLGGVIDRSDQTYTVTATAILGFAASAVGHVTAAVPTIRALIRFVTNGFKHTTQTSSSSDQNNSRESRTKRSYKSLQGSKNGTNYSGDTLGASKGQSKASCDASDPYMLSATHDLEGADESLELRPVETFVTKHTQPGGLQSHSNGHGTVSEISGPVLGDSASDEAILTRDYLK